MVALSSLSRDPIRQTAQSVPDILDPMIFEGGDEVCPAGLATHAQQTRQSMPSQTGKACSAEQAKHAQQDKQSMVKGQAKHAQQD